MESKTYNWGKCRVLCGWTYAGSQSASLKSLPIGAEDSTTLDTEEGNTTEGTIEGGEIECVRYGRNKYTLTTEIRTLTGRLKPFKDSDGVISGTGWVLLVPEDNTAYGLLIQCAAGRLVDSYTAADGGRLKYSFKAQKPAAGDQCKWGTVTIKDTSEQTITDIDSMTVENIKSISFQPIAEDDESTPSAINVYTKAS